MSSFYKHLVVTFFREFKINVYDNYRDQTVRFSRDKLIILHRRECLYNKEDKKKIKTVKVHCFLALV